MGIWVARVLAVSGFSGTRTTRRCLPLEASGVGTAMAALVPEISGLPRLAASLGFRTLDDFRPESWRGSLGPDEVDAVLHSGPFQALEAAWRGAELLSHEVGPDTTIELLDASAADLKDDPTLAFRGAASDPLARRTLLLLDLDIGSASADEDLLGKLAELAERWRIPLVTHAAAGLLGAKHASHAAALPDPAGRLDAAWGSRWREFREADAARWVSLTFNRFLLRSSYTKDRDGHPESAPASRPETLLWGRGIWFAGVDALRSVRQHWHPLALGGLSGDRFHTNLPTWTWTAQGRGEVVSSVEASLDRDEVKRLIRAGLSPLFEPSPC